MKQLSELIPGDYAFYIPGNVAFLITPAYEDGNYMTCALAALSKFPECYRPATTEEAKFSADYKKESDDHLRNIWRSILEKEAKDDL